MPPTFSKYKRVSTLEKLLSFFFAPLAPNGFGISGGAKRRPLHAVVSWLQWDTLNSTTSSM